MKKYRYSDKLYFLHEIQPGCVKVVHKDVCGYYGVSEVTQGTLAFTFTLDENMIREQHGIMLPPKYKQPMHALNELCKILAENQRKKEEECGITTPVLAISHMLSALPDAKE